MSEAKSSKKKAIVLGAGMVGSAIARDLAETAGLDVHIADARPEGLSRVRKSAPVEVHQLDLSNADVVRKLVRGFDLAIGALPSVIGLSSVRACLEAGADVVDISFMPEDARVLDPVAREHGVTAITDCGVAPGLSNMMATSAAGDFDVCERVEISVGGLPAVRKWPFNYKAGFAPWDVLEEYTRPARIVESGKVETREAMSGLELVDIPEVGTLESFITDGLRSLADTLKVPFMQERTLRWPGHVEQMKLFRETGLFSLEPIEVAGTKLRPRDFLAALLFPKWTFDEGEADITVMRVRAWGVRENTNRTITYDFLDRFDARSGIRSMSRSTGFTATAVARLLLDGGFKRPGVHAPEVLSHEAGALERVIDDLKARGIRVERRID